MKHFNWHIGLLVFLVFAACEEPIERQTLDGANTEIVVEGMITNERLRHRVRLTQIFENLNETPTPITNAFAAITDGEEVFLMERVPDEPGYYQTVDSVRGTFGKPYLLYLIYDEKEYTGGDLMGAVSPLQRLLLNQNDQGLFTLMFRNTGDPSMIHYDLDWSGTTDCQDPSDCRARIIQYSINNADVNEVFPPDKEVVYFPAGTRIIRKKFSLSERHQEYLRALQIETEWRGSIFDVAKGNVQGNMSDGALGFFAASTVVSDTTFVE